MFVVGREEVHSSPESSEGDTADSLSLFSFFFLEFQPPTPPTPSMAASLATPTYQARFNAVARSSPPPAPSFLLPVSSTSRAGRRGQAAARPPSVAPSTIFLLAPSPPIRPSGDPTDPPVEEFASSFHVTASERAAGEQRPRECA